MKEDYKKFAELAKAVEGFVGLAVMADGRIILATTQRELGADGRAVSVEHIIDIMMECGIRGSFTAYPAADGCIHYELFPTKAMAA